MKIDGRFWLTQGDENFLGSGRVKLLELIDKTGSINSAAKEMKMSYKAAWERINQMDKIADEPLLQRIIGGKGGGGTKLTEYARNIIKTFYRLDELHREFINRFASAGDDSQRLARILSRTFLTTSARNQLHAKIAKIENYGINSFLHLKIGNDYLISSITTKSVQNMGLEENCDVYAIIKSSDFIISTTSIDKQNTLTGKIKQINSTDNEAEITVVLESGIEIIAVVQLDFIANLEVGTKVFTTINPSQIIIGI